MKTLSEVLKCKGTVLGEKIERVLVRTIWCNLGISSKYHLQFHPCCFSGPTKFKTFPSQSYLITHQSQSRFTRRNTSSYYQIRISGITLFQMYSRKVTIVCGSPEIYVTVYNCTKYYNANTSRHLAALIHKPMLTSHTVLLNVQNVFDQNVGSSVRNHRGFSFRQFRS